MENKHKIELRNFIDELIELPEAIPNLTDSFQINRNNGISNNGIKFAKYQVSNIISNAYKNSIVSGDKYSIKDLYKFAFSTHTKKFVNSILLLFMEFLKHFFLYSKCYLRINAISINKIKDIDNILIINQNHLNQLPSNLKKKLFKKNTLIIDIDRPYKSIIINNYKQNGVRFPFFFKYIKGIGQFFISGIRIINNIKVNQFRDQVLIEVLIRNLSNNLFYSEIEKRVRKFSSCKNIYSTKVSNFDFILFAKRLENFNSILTTGLVHGIIEDPLFYNSCLKELFVFGEFDKKLMLDISDYSSVKTYNTFSIEKISEELLVEGKVLLLILSAGEGIKNELIEKFINQAISVTNNIYFTEYVIRMHPKSDVKSIENICRSILKEKKYSISSSGTNLELQLKDAKFCISMYSSTILAVGFANIPFLISLPFSLSDQGFIGSIPLKHQLEHQDFEIREKDIRQYLSNWIIRLYLGK